MPHPRSLRTALLSALSLGVVISGTLVVLLVTSSSVDVDFLTRENAFAEMDRVRAQFPDQVPCIDRREDQVTPEGGARGSRPSIVHMLAWEREDARLIRASTPYWALRIGAFKLKAARLMVPPLERISAIDLERCGAGLVVDRETSGGGRLVVWAE